MQYGFDFPPFNELSDPHVVMEIAAAAEDAGWDGVFVWDHILYREPVHSIADPWILLAAIATSTSRVRIGAMVTPLPRRRPEILAKQVATLDHLSRGRMVTGLGLGLDGTQLELTRFGEEADDRTRAAMLDEGIDVLRQLWLGEPVTFSGHHYSIDGVTLLPRPYQRPYPPVWLAGRWPYRRPLRRAASHQGVVLIQMDEPDQLREAVSEVVTVRGSIDDFDVVVVRDPDSDPTPWAEAGATWWLTQTPYTATASEVMDRAKAGPPGS